MGDLPAPPHAGLHLRRVASGSATRRPHSAAARFVAAKTVRQNPIIVATVSFVIKECA
ncbi:MAG: hypothetical protein HGA19_19435 [Oscillochloris sp.]|nr:hypothetical protein [Oscillochloris sp.]